MRFSIRWCNWRSLRIKMNGRLRAWDLACTSPKKLPWLTMVQLALSPAIQPGQHLLLSFPASSHCISELSYIVKGVRTMADKYGLCNRDTRGNMEKSILIID